MQTRFTHRLSAGAGFAACAAALFISSPASAQTEAITNIVSANGAGNSQFTIGYNFTLSSAVNVTSLGYFDYGANGLTDAHAVGIYNAAGTLLFQTTVTSGTSAVLGTTFNGVQGVIGGFRYVSLASAQTLAAGSYTIGGYTASGADTYTQNASSVSSSSPVTLGLGQSISTPGGLSATAPVGNSGANSYYGPSFQFTSATGTAGPEPGTIALFGTGLVSMGGITLRRRKKSAK